MRVPLTIGDFLERAAVVHGDRIGAVDEPGVAGSLGSITYRELHGRARGMAVRPRRPRRGHGARVAIVSPNSGRFLVSFFGVSGFGRVLVPVNFRLNTEEIRYIVAHSGAEVLLYDPELEEQVADIDVSPPVRPRRGADEALFAPAAPGTRRPGGTPTRTPPARSTTRRAPPHVPRGSS